MADVGGIRGTQTQTTQIDTTQGKDVTGSGITGASGPAPDPTSPTYTSILQSLGAFMPQLASEMVDILLAEVVSKMKDIQEKNNTERLQIDEEKKRTMLTQKREKLDEATEKVQDAIAKEESSSIWDKIKLGFQALGAAIMIGLGVALLFIPGFQAVGALMITAGVISAIMVADALTKELSDSGMGIMGNIVLAAGGSEEQAMDADLGFGIALAVVGIAVAIATFFVPGGQANAMATMAQSIATIAGAVINITTATGDIAAGVVRYQAADLRADASELQAEAKEMEALMQILDAFMDQVMSFLMGSNDRFNEMIDGLMQNIQDKGATLSKAQFTG